MIAAADFARLWLADWNSHDLDAILGHYAEDVIFTSPKVLGFTGGKSAATGLGVLLAISWPVGLGAGAAFVAVLAISRIASLSSMLAVLVAVALVFSLEQPIAYRLLVTAGAAYVIARHRANIQRLRAGTAHSDWL